MRPDPWQREKSKRYQAKRKARGLEVKTSKEEDGKKGTTRVEGGFKFVKPMPAPQPQQLQSEGTDEDDEDEYDVGRLEDVGFDFSTLSLQELNGPDEYFSAEELRAIDEAVEFEISGFEEMSKWLQDRLKGRTDDLLKLEVITTSDVPSFQSPTVKSPVAVVKEETRPRTNPLEDMLDDLLDT